MPQRPVKYGHLKVKLLVVLAAGLGLVLYGAIFISHYLLRPPFSYYGAFLDVLIIGSVLYPILYFVLVRPYFFLVKSRDEMAMARDQFVGIFQSVGDPMFIFGTDATVQMVNLAACKLLGFNEDELISQPVVKFLSPDDSVNLYKLVDEIFEKGQVNDFKLNMQSKYGEEIPVSLSGSAFSGAPSFSGVRHQRLVGIICVAHDMRSTDNFIADLEQSKRDLELQTSDLTRAQKALLNMMDDLQLTKDDLEHANKELQKIDQLKTDFVSTVSHELRTPMSIVREAISQVIEGLHGPLTSNQKEFLDLSIKNVTRLGHMVDELLDISKIEEGKVELDLRPVDFVGIVRDVAKSHSPMALAKGLQIIEDVSPHSIEILVDRDRVVQVLTNLLANAVKFTEKGSITISVVDSADKIECSVSDTGIGIDQTDIPKVFGKFQQFVRMPGPGERGTGLGLAIAKAIVEMHMGRIWVSSRHGLGSRFTFVLPKNRGESLFEGHLIQGLVHAKAKKHNFSVLVVSMKGIEAVSKGYPREEVVGLRDKLEKVISIDADRSKGRIFRDTERTIIVFENCTKNDAAKLMTQLQHDMKNQLETLFIADKVAVKYGLITFPDDVSNHDEMIEKIKRI